MTEASIKWSTPVTEPTVDANRLNDPDPENLHAYLGSVVKRLISCKSQGWAYENEYRLFLELKKCALDKSSDQYFFPIPPDALKQVILGHYCPLKEKQARDLLDQAGFGGTKVLRAKMSPTSYLIQAG
jgi:hypothetical protein